MKDFPEDIIYSAEHIWLRVDGNMATIGITDYAQEKLGDILSVEFIENDTYVERDETFGSIESVNIIYRDPFDTGWLVVIEMDNLEQLEDLLVASNYHDLITQEESE